MVMVLLLIERKRFGCVSVHDFATQVRQSLDDLLLDLLGQLPPGRPLAK
jgi:hypothetical protein